MAQSNDEDAAHYHLVVLVVPFDHAHCFSRHIEGMLPQRDLCEALVPLCGAGKGCYFGFNQWSVPVVVKRGRPWPMKPSLQSPQKHLLDPLALRVLCFTPGPQGPVF